MTTKNTATATTVASAVVLVVVAGGITAYSMLNKAAVAPTVATTTPTATTPAVITPSTPAQAVVSSYKNGVYDMVGQYTSPGGPEQIDVKLTLTNNIITDATVGAKATLPISQRFQGMFIEGFKEYVVGKNIDEVNLGITSGSSLTPKGFNDALAKIKAQAKA
ncbi:FMN-binding protein [Candidatus Gracilibacteria bacterium]|nr:FMN-binding protein [Candidatus Gracilibacteria bacterium]